MSRVLIFGTFDIIHPGHRFVFTQAKSHGDELWVVLARDSRIQKLKGRAPYYDEKQRKEMLLREPEINEVVLGDESDVYRCLSEVKPDVILLGYDQRVYTENLRSELDVRGLVHTKVIRLKSYLPEIHKSSLLRRQREEGASVSEEK